LLGWRRAITYLAGQEGIRQFLDIGTGLPTANNTHEVAQRIAPASRIVYADNDPLVLAHARALLTSSPEGACDYLDGDLRDPDPHPGPGGTHPGLRPARNSAHNDSERRRNGVGSARVCAPIIRLCAPDHWTGNPHAP